MSFLEEMREKYNFIGTLSELDVSIGYPTGVTKLDNAIEVGGIPGGRITELLGPESSGKTSLALSTIARLHESTDDKALYLDLENALYKPYAVRMGIDPERLVIFSPEWGEQAFDLAEQGIRCGEFSIVVVDSVPAISPRKEMEGDIGDSHVGLVPRLVSQFLRKTAFAVRESEVAVIFINQLRDRIARVPLPPESPGGRGLKHHVSVRIFLRNAGAIKNGVDSIGSKIEYTVKKSKIGGQYNIGAFEIWNDRGVCKEANLLDEAVDKKVFKLKGSWFIYGENTFAQGRVAAVEKLSEEDWYERILQEIKNANIPA